MASLIEELITVMQEEEKEYRLVLSMSEEKTGIIIKNDLEALKEMAEREQVQLSKIVNLEKKRQDVVKDIAVVLNKDVKTLKVEKIVEMLSKQKKEQKALSEARDGLKQVLGNLQRVNDLNQNLIKESMDMLEFELNLARGAGAVPQTANYSRKASNVQNSYMFITRGNFDAKQ